MAEINAGPSEGIHVWPSAGKELSELVGQLDPEMNPLEALARRVPYTGQPPLTHRFRSLGFQIDKNTLVRTVRLDVATNCNQCHGIGSFIVYDECERCMGAGCSHCSDGQVRVVRVCDCRRRPLDKRGGV